MSSTAPAPPKGPPPGAGLPAKVLSIPPNQTLYVRGLPSANIQKEDLRTALYMLFSTYGAVLDVVALKTMKMRGQAHIVYRDIQTATQAMRALNGFTFLGQPLQIAYARGRSDIIGKLDGTFRAPNTSAANVEVTALQQSIFNAPVPGSAPAATPAKPPTGADHVMVDAKTIEGRGHKRTREEEDEEEEEEEEEEDSDVAMEEDSDEE